jgi:hypothetical protein
MSTELYGFTVPLLTRGLSILATYMDKAIKHAEATGTSEDVMFKARLASDMSALSSQIQMACDKAKNGVARLTGRTAPAYPDTETTFHELSLRIAKTKSFVDAITLDQFEGAGDRLVELRYKGAIRTMNGHDYLTKVLLPDFYFHVATTHGILRHCGLAVGKADYLGDIV